MRRATRLLPAGLAVLVLLALALAIIASKDSSTTATSSVVNVDTAPAAGQGGFDGAGLPAARPAAPFDLTDQYGRAVSLASLGGRPVVLAFLYSHCGGPCVLIAQQIRGALDELAGNQAVSVEIVSADPAGDTAASVRSFLAEVSLTGRVHYLTGTTKELQRVWRSYGVHPASTGSAQFAKFATVHLLDSLGRERVLYGAEQLTPEALVHDIRELQGEAAHP